jgi:serine/threonine protein kinase/Leucine-rich repeat (LRR) protein
MEVPGFEMVEKLGQGGMATVWKARQISLDRIVAIKVLSAHLSSDPDDVQMFQKEAQSAAKLKHPGIVQVYDANAHDGAYYFVMEYVAGYTVGDWIRRKGVVPEKDALLVVECVAEALGYAWDSAKIIHCDIKPDNVMIDADGTVKVADLGLARTVNAISDEAEVEEVMGTPAYIAPEQAMGNPDLDFRADVYSLGAMLYHLVTGKILFAGVEDEKVMEMQVSETVADPHDINPKLSKSVCWLIEKMLAKEPEDRHASWAEVKSDVAKVKAKHITPSMRIAEGLSTVRRSEERMKTDVSHRVSASDHPVKSLSTGKLVVIAIVLLAIAAGVVGMIMAQKKEARRKPTQVRVIAPVRLPTTPAKRVGTPTKMSGKEKAAKEMFDDTVKWQAANLDKPGEAIARFKAVANNCMGTQHAVKAVAKARKLQDELDLEVRAIVAQLDSKASPYIRRGLLEGAIGVYEDYTGKLRPETEKSRQQRIAGIEEKQKEKDRAVAATKKAAQDRFDEVIAETCRVLINSGVGPAMDSFSRAAREQQLRPLQPKLDPVRNVLTRAVELDEHILASFRGARGRQLNIQFVSGRKTVVIEDVVGDKVKCRQKMGSRGGVVSTSFMIKDLSVRERLARIGSDDKPEVALVKGLMALNSKADSYACAFFQKTEPTLGRLLIAMTDLGSDAKKPASKPAAEEKPAAQPAPEIQPLRGPRRRKGLGFGLQGKLKTVKDGHGEIIEKLLNANPELIEDDIALYADSDGKVRRVVIVAHPIEDVSALSMLKDLREVVCSPRSLSYHYGKSGMSGTIESIEFVRGLKLEILAIGSAAVRDLSPLRGMYLKQLVLRHSKVTDLSPIKGMPIERLSLKNTDVQDIMVLRGMPLKSLDLSGTRIFEIRSLSRAPLEVLDLSDTQIRDISPLAGSSIEELNIANTKVHSFLTLVKLPLAHLNLSGTQVKDIGFLRGKQLSSLDISSTPVSKIDVLKGMPIGDLSLADTNIRDYSVLKGLPLTSLNVSKSNLKDLGCLKGLSLSRLDMSGTGVTDLSPLNGMELTVLSMNGVELDDFRIIRKFPLTYLSVRGIPLARLSVLKGCSLSSINVSGPSDRGMLRLLRTMPKLEKANGRSLAYWAKSKR